MLPAANLLSINVTDIETYSIKTGLFGAMRVDPDLHDAALNTAQEQITTLACNSQILEIAAQNAERSIEGLFALMDGVQVIVTSRAPGSCAPASP